MANEISKIKLPNNTTYDIKDVSARSAAATAQSTADGKISSSLKGVANGVAELDANGLVPTSQLPSYVDDVLEYATKSVFPTTGESGKIYVDISTNLTYRWSGTAYVEISPSLALGETSSTAYRGDRGKTAYAHATDSNRLTTATAVGLYKVGVTTQGHVSGLTAVAKADITALGIPAQDTTYSSGTGITISGTTINHSNSVTAGTAKGDDTKTLSFGGTFTIPTVTYDAQGHVTAKGKTTMTMPSNPNTDRYVNSAAFANDTSGVKMTLTRAGSDTATVTGTIPLVSSSTAGVAPKGTAVSSQSQSTKFLREDGSWAAPSYTTNTNTTYTLSVGTGDDASKIILTPSSGTANKITVPYATSAGSATKATQDSDGNVIKSTYLKLSGGTMTGAITFANGVKNVVGDDSAIGDCNMAGTLGLIGANGTTGLAFFLKDTTWGSSGNYAKFSYDGTSMSLSKPFNIQGTNGSWIVTGKSPTVYVKKSSGSGALGAYGVDTKTGRFVLSTYPSSDDLVYFNWFSDTTLAGTTNTVDKQFTWTPSTNTLGTNISGTAAIANKLGSSNVGSATQPIYLSAGTATACTYTLGKSVPSNAVFTDTNTTYTLSADTTSNTIKLTPSSGNTQSITVPYASSAGSVSIPTANPEIATYYMPIFGYGTGDTDTPILYKHSNDYTYYLREGTTSHVGESALILGNGVSSGTDGNSRGELLLYSEGAVRSALMMTNSGSSVVSTYNHYLPAVEGTIGVFTATPTSGQVVVTDGTAGGFKTTGYTIAKSVPSNAVFTDTNNAVTQTATSTNANYEVLFSATADNTSRTESARKNSNLIFNPVAGLKIGTSSQSAFPTTGIQVHDVRSVNFTPGALDQGVNFFFSNNTMPNGNWWSGIHVKGWTGAYAAWEIVGSAHNNDSRTAPLYVRSSNTNSAWGSWRKIYDTSNPPTKSEVGLGNVDNTADANKSVSYATTSGTANTAKSVLTAGGDVIMGTTGSDSDDSGDIVWRYGNGNEKARLYTANEYTAKSGLNYRVYKKDGTSLYTGTIPLADGTGASGTWGISISGSAGSATSATTASKLSTNAGSATNPVYFTGGVPTACTYSLNKTVPSDAVFTDHYAWSDITGKPSTYVPSAHTHYVSELIWARATYLTCTTDINNGDWRTILDSGTKTGCYWNLWSAKNTKSIIKAENDTCNVTVGGEIISGSGLELGMASADSASFIDFHWGSNNTDYTARIIQRSESTLDLIGKNGSTWGIWKAASFSSQSSIFVKENISSITDDEAKRLLQLRPVVFDYKGDGLKNQRGLIAEEVMDIMPEMVIIPQGYTEYDPIEPWNTPCIDYSKFVPYLIKMVQIQQDEINELKAKIKD